MRAAGWGRSACWGDEGEEGSLGSSVWCVCVCVTSRLSEGKPDYGFECRVNRREAVTRSRSQDGGLEESNGEPRTKP